MLTLIRRIIVLAIAAVGLAREWPYEIVALRAAGLWAILYICSLALELVLQHLSYSALRSEHAKADKAKSKAGERTGVTPAA
ncbi:hypothetical protein KKG66_12140 [bacterium]|nr:hypothetical protein [bacterium]MBU1921589.1 hypothetical protein [bacterium]RQV95012.1 MAG: hypothetical protein EH220_06705 [bacterium]